MVEVKDTKFNKEWYEKRILNLESKLHSMESLAKTTTPFSLPHNEEETDLYFRMQELERELELLTMQEEFLKDEQRHLKSEYIRSKEEVNFTEIWLIFFRSNKFRLSTSKRPTLSR